jgi:Uma2 family endonuclease
MTSIHNAPRGVKVAATPPTQLEQQLRLSLIDWPTYVAFSDGLGPRHVRTTYADGEMELMTLGRKHERAKKRLAMLVEALAQELDLDIEPGGSMTCRRQDQLCGLEPDECYWIKHEPAMRNRDEFDALRDPPPDLAIEVEISRSSINRMEIYARLNVPEVWRWDGETLSFSVLVRGRRYEEATASRSFPGLRAADLQAFLKEQAGDSLGRVLQNFRKWARKQAAKGRKP